MVSSVQRLCNRRLCSGMMESGPAGLGLIGINWTGGYCYTLGFEDGVVLDGSRGLASSKHEHEYDHVHS